MPASAVPELKLAPGELFIGGRFTPAASCETADDINPATVEPLCQVARAAAEDLDRAVAAARRAFEDGPWPRMTPRERGRLLMRIAEAIEANAEDLALRESLDVGKPLTYTRAFDVPSATGLFAYYGGMVEELADSAARPGGTPLPTRAASRSAWSGRSPRSTSPRPVRQQDHPRAGRGEHRRAQAGRAAPLSALKLAEIMTEAGLPDVVYNVVTGEGRTIGEAMIKHPGIGKHLIVAAADTLKKVTVELGGKGAQIIFADPERAVESAFQGAFFHTGQFCLAGSRLLVERSAYPEIVDRLAERVEAAKVGDPLDPATELGTACPRQQLDKVADYVRIGQQERATLRAGAGRGQRRRGTAGASTTCPPSSPTAPPARGSARKRSSARC